MSDKSRRKNSRFVEHQAIARLQKTGQISNRLVLNGLLFAIQNHQARVRTMSGWFFGDSARRQFVRVCFDVVGRHIENTIPFVWLDQFITLRSQNCINRQALGINVKPWQQQDSRSQLAFLKALFIRRRSSVFDLESE